MVNATLPAIVSLLCLHVYIPAFKWLIIYRRELNLIFDRVICIVYCPLHLWCLASAWPWLRLAHMCLCCVRPGLGVGLGQDLELVSVLSHPWSRWLRSGDTWHVRVTTIFTRTLISKYVPRYCQALTYTDHVPYLIGLGTSWDATGQEGDLGAWVLDLGQDKISTHYNYSLSLSKCFRICWSAHVQLIIITIDHFYLVCFS